MDKNKSDLDHDWRPLYTWMKPCRDCPTAQWPHDPESEMLASLPTLEERMEHTFPCAWRPDGYCQANQRLQYEGILHD